MAEHPFTLEDLETLRQWDTPTICNALEFVAPARRGHGFTVRPLVAADRKLQPICGLARTGTIRAAAPSGRPKEVDRKIRLGWYEYVERASLPTIVVLQDLDDTPGVGAFWGEVHSAVHKALGAQGGITNGSIRDLDMLAPGFQLLAGVVNPSHAFVHMVAYGQEVTVHGMHVQHEDVIHADHHGAVVIPHDAVRKIPAAIELGARKEKVILDLCKDPDFSAAKLAAAIAQADEIH
ncbi:RraA family protein [Falsiroseomonas tokyonensis]|uniref:RraA family protein n=1 Tax=Falsiroseomonas tokyonensis TaxID=430521 RepID=A0ABV7BV19_9PROT|nr:RraA family protein [Falsiroseomonas tokyonensis]MBU8538009.1 RraA family protein [Falsiroseomonas tokyonensis]